MSFLRGALPGASVAVLSSALLLTTSLQAAEPTSLQQQISELQSAVAAQKAQLEAQQKLLEQQAAVIDRLSKQAAAAASAAATPEKKTDSPVVTMNQGRPTISSADGRSSLSVRAVVQLDAAKHDQAAAGPLATDFRRGSVGGTGNREINAASDLSDGIYFRRARFGVEGLLAKDFEYRFVMELGGAGVEGPTRINDAWIGYSGFAPFRIQLGAFSPPANMDDQTGVEDLLFIERASPAEISRSLAGADGRIGLGVRSSGERWTGAMTLTSRTFNDAEVFDSQLALVSRFAFLAAQADTYNLHVGASGTWVFSPADQGISAAGARYPIRFRDRPEVRVDSTRLIDSGSLDADSAYAAGVELAGNWKNLYLQAENFWYGVDRRQGATPLPDPNFGGYYVQGSWVVTGESRRYNRVNGSYQSPRPRTPFSTNGGIGAWELAMRYSHTDLDFHAGLPGTQAATDSVRGGVQDIWALGLNWYPNTNVRLMLDYLHIDADRLNPAGVGNLTPFGASPLTPPLGVQIGQDLNVYALRSQYSF